MSARDKLVSLVKLAQEAENEGDLETSLVTLEQVIRTAKYYQLRDINREWDLFLDGVFVQYGLLVKKINPEQGLDIWKKLAKRFSKDQFKKTEALKVQLECLCDLENWKQVINLSTVALRELEALSPRSSNDPNILSLEKEILALIELAKAKDDQVDENEVDPDWLPKECHNWAGGAIPRIEKKPKSKKKKRKMKVVSRKGYDEEQTGTSASGAAAVQPGVSKVKAEGLGAVAGSSSANERNAGRTEPPTSIKTTNKHRNATTNKDCQNENTTDVSDLTWNTAKTEPLTSSKTKHNHKKKKKKTTKKDGSQSKSVVNSYEDTTDVSVSMSKAYQQKNEHMMKWSSKDKKKDEEPEPSTSSKKTNVPQKQKKANQAKDGSQNKRLKRLAKREGNTINCGTAMSQPKKENLKKSEQSSTKTSSRYRFPLEKTHDFVLGCPRCSKEVNSKWTVEAGHSGCAESVLFVRKKQDSAKLWIKIRNRQSLVCYNTYKACQNFPDAPCHRNDREKCFFAHGQEEIQIWNAEKFHGFSIDAFKLQNKGRTVCRKSNEKNGGDKQFKAVSKPVWKSARPNASERIDLFCKLYPGNFRYTQDIVVYTHKGDDIRIRKPKDGARRSELCRNSYCLEGNCALAHSEVERDFWLLAADTEFTFENICKRLCPPIMAGPAPIENPLEIYYCNFCFKQCNGPLQLERHCNSKLHMDKVTAEDGDQWQHREPPPRLQLKLCAEHHEKGTCWYSNAPQDFNKCVEAHSQEELEEWMQRRDVRHQKMRLAKQKDLLSYVVKLEQKFEDSLSLTKLMKEKLKDVTVEVSKDLKQALQDKSDAITWKFKIFTKDLNLRNVALLKDKDRFWFQLDHRGKSHVQHLTESDLETYYKVAATEDKDTGYEIWVRFKGGAFGTYRQWLVLDFGKLPYLVRRLEVDVGEKLHEDMERLRASLKTDHWTAESVTIIPFGDPTIGARTEDDFMKKMKVKYRLQPGEVSSNVVSEELKKVNYVQKMHDLLYMEETRQLQMMAR